MIKLTSKIKESFSSFETTIQTMIWVLIPLMVFFSVMSDRTPYNYINFVLYGIESILILFYVFKYKRFVIDHYSLIIVLFNLMILVSQIVNGTLLEFPRTILLLSLFSIIFYQFVITVETKESLFLAILVGGVFFAIYFILYYRTALLSFSFADRLGDKFSDQNDLAKYLCIFAIISLLFSLKKQKFERIIYICISLVFLFLILATGSISNLLCLASIAVLILIFSFKGKKKLVVISVLVAITGIIILVLQLPFMSYFKTRIEGIFSAFFKPVSKVDNSALDRFSLFKQSLQMFLSKPIFGFGYDQVIHYTHGHGAFSHNNFTELLASFGFFGFILFEFLLFYPIYIILTTNKKDRFTLYTLAYLFIFQTFLVIFRKKVEYFILPIAFASTFYGAKARIEITLTKWRLKFNKVASVKDQNLGVQANTQSLL